MILFADTNSLTDKLALNFRKNDWLSALQTASELINADSSNAMHYFAHGMTRYEWSDCTNIGRRLLVRFDNGRQDVVENRDCNPQ